MDITGMSVRVDTTEVDAGSESLKKFTGRGKDAEDATKRLEDRAGKAASAFSGLGRVIGSIAVGYLIKEFIELADKAQLLDSRLKLATESLREFSSARAGLTGISERNNQSLEAAISLFSRLNDPVARAGGSVRETQAIVDAFQKTLRISGASAVESAAATLQFAQAMGSGKLAGDEFRSISEAAPRFLRAVSDSMGVTTGSLKQMAADGKLTADVIGNALIGQLQNLTAEANVMPQTVGAAIQKLANDVMQAAGRIGSGSGMTQGLAESIEVLREFIPIIEDGINTGLSEVNRWMRENNEEITSTLRDGKIILEVFGMFAREVWNGVQAIGAVSVGSGLLRTTLEAVLIVVAGLADGVEILGASFMKIGGLIVEWVTRPLLNVGKTVSSIIEPANARVAAGITATIGRIEDMTRLPGEAADAVFKKFAEGGSRVAIVTKQIEKSAEEAKRIAELKAQGLADNRGAQGRGALDYLSATATLHTDGASDAANKKAAANAAKEARAEQAAYNQSLKEYQREMSAAESALEKASRRMRDQQNEVMGLTESQAALREYLNSTAYAFAMNLNPALATATVQTFQLADAEERRANLQDFKTGQLYQDLMRLNPALAEATAAELENEGATRRNINAKNDEIRAIQKLYEEQSSLAEWAEGRSPLSGALFDAAGAARDLSQGLAGVVSALGNMALAQEQMNKEMEKAGGINDLKLRAQVEQQIIADNTKAQLNSYAQMAGGLKSMFKKNSTEYKAMEAIQKAFYAVEMAMALQAAFQKVTAVTMATQAEVSSVGPTIAATEAKTTAKATEAVATQATAGPYIGFALAAAMLVFMASIGAKTGGGGGVSVPSYEEAQKTQGTGTIFGDSSAKSDSIANSIEKTKDAAQTHLKYASAMLSALNSIDSQISGFVSVLLRLPGLTTGKISGVELKNAASPGGAIMREVLTPGATIANKVLDAIGLGFIGNLATPLADKIGSAIFGGKVTSSISNTGVYLGSGSVGQYIDNSVGMGQFTEVENKKSGGWFSSSKTWTDRYGQEFDASTKRQVGLMFQGLADNIAAAAGALGMNVKEKVLIAMGTAVNIGDVSLFGMKGSEVTDALSNVFSAAFDQVVAKVMPELSPFQRVGEGMYETMNRVAVGYEQAGAAVRQTGLALVDWKNVLNPLAEDIGGEFVRSSILAAAASGKVSDGVAQIMTAAEGTAAEVAGLYVALVSLQDQMRSLKLDASGLTADMITAAGGLDALTTGVAAYASGFFTESERIAMQTQNLSAQFERFGVAMPQTRDEFKNLVNSLDLTTEAGQKAFGILMSLAPAFDDWASAVEDAASRIASARDSLTERLYSATGDDEALKALKRKKEWESTAEELRPLLETVWQAEDDKAERDKAAAAAAEQKRQAEAAAQAQAQAVAAAQAEQARAAEELARQAEQAAQQMAQLGESIRQTISSLLGTTQSAESRAAAMATVETSIASLRAGGGVDQSAVQSALSALSSLDSSQFGSYEEYMTAKYGIAGRLDLLARMVEAKASGGAIPMFADGGDHAGGWRIVGENGPELEFTGPGAIVSHADAKNMLDTGALQDEIAELRAEMARYQYQIALSTQRTAKVLDRWDGEGMPEVRT